MSYKIPLFDLNFDEEEEHAVVETLRSKWISTGPKTKEFENTFADMLGAKHAVALSNCTVSLHLAMKLMNIGPGDEVICPSLTFVATVNAILYVGGIPIFCDIKSPQDLTIDPEKAEALITDKTKAIVVMHYGGFACDMDRFLKIAQKHNLKLIEDACHGPLSEYRGCKLGTIGDAGCFSFFSNKNISTGEGGMIIINDQTLDDKARMLRSHGMTSMSYDRSKGHSTSYDVVELGYNYRMDDIHASIGLVQLKKLRSDLRQRALVRKWYEAGLTGIDSIIIPFKGYCEFSSNYIFPIILKDGIKINRDEFRDALHLDGIQTSIHYPPVHLFTIYQSDNVNLPITEYVGRNLITLPMYGALTKSQVLYIVETIKRIIN